MKPIWEESISRNPQSDQFMQSIGSVGDYIHQKEDLPSFLQFDAGNAVARDRLPLPSPEGREGYFANNHLAYWMSGLKDSNKLMEACLIHGSSLGKSGKPQRCLDFGGASGRVARHLYLQHQLEEVWLTDINREHINFVSAVFDGVIRATQQSHIPNLPFEDSYFDLICSYSVFTHIETFDDAWLLELRRILRPGGLIYLTANIDNLEELDDTWPAYKGLRNHQGFRDYSQRTEKNYNRMVFRWSPDSPYSSQVFVSKNYVATRWIPFFRDFEISKHSFYQSGLTLIK